MNQVVVTGRLTRDPEYKQTSAGEVVKLSIAHNENRIDSNGREVSKVHFFDVSGFKNFVGQSRRGRLRKGSMICVSGKLDYQSWDAQDGTKRSKIAILGYELQPVAAFERDDQQQAPRRTPEPRQQEEESEEMSYAGVSEDTDGEVPF